MKLWKNIGAIINLHYSPKIVDFLFLSQLPVNVCFDLVELQLYTYGSPHAPEFPDTKIYRIIKWESKSLQIRFGVILFYIPWASFMNLFRKMYFMNFFMYYFKVKH